MDIGYFTKGSIDMSDTKQVQIDTSKVLPIFADEVVVISKVKSLKTKDSKSLDKEGHVEIIFLDQINPQQPRAVSRIVVSKNTAESLHRILAENVQKLGVELKSKKMPVQKKSEKTDKKSPEPKHDYLG